MIFLGFEIRRTVTRSITITSASKIMSEAEINRAFQVASTDPQWCAVMQLLETAEENANAQAAANIDSTNRMAGYVGAAEHLALVRAELVRRREAGLAELRVRPQQKSAVGGQQSES